MKKQTFNGFSQTSDIFYKTNPKRSIKENLNRRPNKSLTVNESSRVLKVMQTNKIINKETFIDNKSTNICNEPTIVRESSTLETCKNLEKIKESIKDILSEGMAVDSEVQKLKQKLEYGSSCRESYRSGRGLISVDESSKGLDNLGIQNEILELKNQVLCLNERLSKGEELIKAKAFENYSLQFQAFNLDKKLKKIRSKREAMENTKCSICEIF